MKQKHLSYLLKKSAEATSLYIAKEENKRKKDSFKKRLIKHTLIGAGLGGLALGIPAGIKGTAEASANGEKDVVALVSGGLGAGSIGALGGSMLGALGGSLYSLLNNDTEAYKKALALGVN